MAMHIGTTTKHALATGRYARGHGAVVSIGVARDLQAAEPWLNPLRLGRSKPFRIRAILNTTPTFLFKAAYYFFTPLGMTSFKGNNRDSNLRRRFHHLRCKHCLP